MIYYTPEMFTLESLRDILEPLFMEKETLEFQIDIYQKKFDLFRKVNYKELLIYERKRALDSSLLPSLHVLSQIKVIEKDEAVKEFRQILSNLKRELSNIENEISNEENKIKKMFTFKDVNLRKYLNEMSLYYKGILSFENIMRNIFNNEFLNAEIYTDVHGLRNYKIIEMLIKNCPLDWKLFFRIIYVEAVYVYTIEDLMNSSPEEVDAYIQIEEQRRNKRYSDILEKISNISIMKERVKSERSALDMSLTEIPRNISSQFVRLRQERHKEIINNLQKGSLGLDLINGRFRR